MSRIDVKHVLLGGVAAAILLNACDWVITTTSRPISGFTSRMRAAWTPI